MSRTPIPLALAVLAAACATATSTGRTPAPSEPSASAPPASAPRGDPLAEGEAALRANDFARAEPLLGDAQRARPGDARVIALRARAQFFLARFDDALATAQAANAIAETYDGRLVEGRVLAIRRKLDPAAAAFERCAAIAPSSAEAWSALAGARLALGDDLAAGRAWNALSKLEPVGTAEDRLWTDILRMQPDPAQIQEALDRSARGTAAYMAGDLAGAMHELRAVVGGVPGFAHAWSELGKAAWKRGQLAEAERSFRSALARYRPDQAGLRADTEAHLAALLVERRGDAREALRLVRAAIEVRGERPDALDTLARACDAARDVACARDAYRKLAVAETPEPLRERAASRLRTLGP